jgi:pimeloyl-ACP methyl ester carboxylesterase
MWISTFHMIGMLLLLIARLRLRDIQSLLPYHSHVDPATVVDALNHMIDDVNRGNTIVYDIYADGDKKKEPSKSHTGLFFFRGRPGAPFAIIAPGGGFSYTGHSEYAANEPPTFVVVGEQDAIASPAAMERRVNALRKAGTVVEFHRYRALGHGFGPGIGTSAEGWIERAVRFWETSTRSNREPR